MTQKLLVVFVALLMFGALGSLNAAGNNIILWEDHFEDDDPAALHNVGWIYYPEQDVAGQVVEQRDAALFIEAGSYGGLAGVGLVETNGLPQISLDADGNITQASVDSSLMNMWSDPNQELTFKVNFARFSTSFFAVATRMPIDSSRGDSDPTEAPAYALLINPLQGGLALGRYTEPMQALQPDTWTYFAQGAYAMEIGVDYWVKYYLNEGDLKAKIWEGDLSDEPEAWLLEAVDQAPRVTGKFTMFALLGLPPNPGEGDRIILDDIVMRKSGVVPVTFMVDMSVQEELGSFDPNVDMLVVRGGFNSWSGNDDMLTFDENEGLHTLTIGLDPASVGETFEYKFVIIPGAGGDDDWEDVDNRSFTLEAGGLMLDPVFFDNREFVGSTANITFQADMSDMLTKGWFDPVQDQLRVTGAFNGWSDEENKTLQADLLDPSLYVLTIAHTDQIGNEIGWKFRGRPDDRFLDSGWEGGSNHTFVFSGEDIVLEKLKPNLLPAGSPLSQDVTVRFSVNVDGAKDWFNKKLFPSIDGVYLNGDFAPLGAGGWAGWTVADTAGGSLVKMYDDGATGGDETAGDKIYTVEVPFAAGSPSIHLYKFGIYSKAYTDTLNGGVIPMDNEAGFAANHAILIPENAPLYVHSTDIFGSQWRETIVKRTPGVTPTDYLLDQNYPNPFNPSTEISYAIPTDGQVTLTVFNSLGQKVATLVNSKQVAGKYQVTWNGISDSGLKMSSGVYFYHIESEGFAKTMKMIMMK